MNTANFFLSSGKRVLVVYDVDYWYLTDADGNELDIEDELDAQERVEVELKIEDFIQFGTDLDNIQDMYIDVD